MKQWSIKAQCMTIQIRQKYFRLHDIIFNYANLITIIHLSHISRKNLINDK